MFSCEFCEISKSTFFTEHLRTTASSAHIASLPPEVYNHTSFFMWIYVLKNHPRRRVQFRKSFTKKSKKRQGQSAFLEHLEVQILKIFPLVAMVAPSWVRYIYRSTQKISGYITVFLTHRENNFCRLCFTSLNASVEISKKEKNKS